jgi:hypothetical protein
LYSEAKEIGSHYVTLAAVEIHACCGDLADMHNKPNARIGSAGKSIKPKL